MLVLPRYPRNFFLWLLIRVYRGIFFIHLMIQLLIFVICDAIKDSIQHHDSLYCLGKFFQKQTVEAPKTTFLHKYFPMFYDAWHLAKSVGYIALASMLGLGVITTSVIVVLMSWLFIGLYSIKPCKK